MEAWDFASAVLLQCILIARDPNRAISYVVLGNALKNLQPPRYYAALEAFRRALALPSCKHRKNIRHKIRCLQGQIDSQGIRNEDISDIFPE